MRAAHRNLKYALPVKDILPNPCTPTSAPSSCNSPPSPRFRPTVTLPERQLGDRPVGDRAPLGRQVRAGLSDHVRQGQPADDPVGLGGHGLQQLPRYEAVDTGHGHAKRRRDADKDLTDAVWNGYAAPYGCQQAILITRGRHNVRTGETRVKQNDDLTSALDQRSPEQMAAMIGNRWHVESRLHRVRDFTDDEDRC